MHGGSHNVGIDKRVTPAQELPQDAQDALRELLALLHGLRAQVNPISATVIDDSLPALNAGAEVQLQERHRALLAVAGIAATVGTIGAPVVDAVNKILALLGAK